MSLINICFVISLLQAGTWGCAQPPTYVQSHLIADALFAPFAAEEVDKVELVFTRFVSMVRSEPVVQTLLPLSPALDVDGNCIDALEDEVFKLTTEDTGRLHVVAEPHQTSEAPSLPSSGNGTKTIEPLMLVEEDPGTLVEALLPMYLTSMVLRVLHEATASELSSRINAMASASDNALKLAKDLRLQLNRKRQARITAELAEIVAGASGV